MVAPSADYRLFSIRISRVRSRDVGQLVHFPRAERMLLSFARWVTM
jgi:hypothetical protein